MDISHEINKLIEEVSINSNKESCRIFDSLVEVYCYYYKKGDKILYNNCKYNVWLKPLISTIKNINEIDYDNIFIEDNIMFKFKVLTTDSNLSSGILYLLENLTEKNFFGNYLNDFLKYAESLKTKNLSTVKFLTAWSYRSWQDQYTNEWNSDYIFEGFIDYKKLNYYLTQCLIRKDKIYDK